MNIEKYIKFCCIIRQDLYTSLRIRKGFAFMVQKLAAENE